MDRLTKEERSRLMARVRGTETRPEIAVRKAIWRLGFRYRLHVKQLPGRPDIVLPRHKLAIFVHGCFWHRHGGCKRTTMPKTRPDFWSTKFDANMARDLRNVAELQKLGWTVQTVWECDTVDENRLRRALERILPRSRGIS